MVAQLTPMVWGMVALMLLSGVMLFFPPENR
jgi:hypothetical protein